MSAKLTAPFAVGDTVYLRPLEQDDVPDLVQWLNDARVTRTLTLRWPVGMSQQEAQIDSLYDDPSTLRLGIALKADNRLIGSVGLHAIDPIHRRATFGIMIGAIDAWGQGYATEASRLIIAAGFDRLNLNRIELDVYPFNPAARHIYEKLGFRVEGVKRQYHYLDGVYHDVACMGMLRSDWEGK